VAAPDPIGDLFADGTDGYWFADADYSRLAASGLARLYTDTLGNTAATAVTNSIGLMFEEHAGVAIGPEIVVNGGFDADTNWTKGTGWTIAGGVASSLGPGTSQTLTQTPPALPAGFYRTAFDVTALVTGNVQVRFTTTPSVAATPRTTTGSYAEYLLNATATVIAPFSSATANLSIDNVSVKAVAGNHGYQSTPGSRPTIQTAGGRLFLRFDALDDSLLTPFLAQNGANSIIAKVTVPASLAATQVIAGSSGSGANRCFLGVNTSGQLCGGVGSDSTTTIVGTTDLRGLTVVVGLTFDGTTVKLFVEEAEEYSAGQNSTPTVTIPHCIGANNNNGTAGSFFGGDIYHCVAVRKARTLAQFLAIRSQMNAA